MINEEDRIWFNGIYPYLRMLKKINKLLILLIRDNTSIEEQEDNFLELTSELLRILPFKLEIDNKTKTIIGIKILTTDGILLLKEYFEDLEKDYTNIVNTNFVELVETIKIRNKYIHEPHNIKCVYFSCGGNNTHACFEYKRQHFELNTDLLIKLIIELNNVFEKIKLKFKNKVDELNDEEKSHPYIQNILNNYWKNYNSELLKV